MAQLTISLPDELESKLRNYCEDHGYQTVSSLVAESLREKLEAKQPISYWDRVALVVQLENNRLLETLTRGKQKLEGKDWDFNQAHDALTHGYVAEYGYLFEYIYPDELSKYASKYVVDVLAMYDDLQWSAREIEDEEIARLVKFPGFDGNHETAYLGFARYLRDHERFEELDALLPNLNSHGLTPDYRSMLARHDSVRNSKPDRHAQLTPEEIRKIIGR